MNFRQEAVQIGDSGKAPHLVEQIEGALINAYEAGRRAAEAAADTGQAQEPRAEFEARKEAGDAGN